MIEILSQGNDWKLCFCSDCNMIYAAKSNHLNKTVCGCGKLIQQQSTHNKYQLLYILINNHKHIKVGLSHDLALFSRLRTINRECKKHRVRQFKLLYTRIYTNRTIAYSIERLLHDRYKKKRMYKAPYKFNGQGEIYKGIAAGQVLKAIKQLEDRIQSLALEYKIPFSF